MAARLRTAALLFGKHDGQIGLGELELRLDLTPLGRVPYVPQFAAQFLDAVRSSSSHLLEFVY